MNPKSNNTRGFLVALAIVAAVGVSATLAPTLGKLAAILCSLALLVGVSAVLTPRQPFACVNDFGTLNNTTIFHDAFAEFWSYLLPVTRLALNVASEVQLDGGQTVLVRSAKPGDTITIKNWKQAFNVYTVGSGGYNSPTDIEPADKTFTLPSAAKAVSIALTAAEFRVLASGVSGGADYNAFKTKVVAGMLHSLGSAIVSDLLAVITAANFPNETVSATGTFSSAKELAIEKAFFDRSVPVNSGQILLDSTAWLEYVAALAPQQTATGVGLQKPMLFMGERQSAFSPFSLMRVQPAMPADSDRGVALTRTAILAAFRLPDEPTWEGDPVSLSRIIDSRKVDGVEVGSGVPALVRMWKNATTGTMQLDLATIWKFEAGQPEAAQRIVSEATES